MSGPGRLSLRARLLVLLIAVTAAFLLILGAVSSITPPVRDTSAAAYPLVVLAISLGVLLAVSRRSVLN